MSKKKKILITIICIVILIPIIMLGKIIYIHYQTKDGISIVGYHGVVSDDEKERLYADNQYFLSESQFKRQMQYLYENKYETLTMSEIYDYYQGNRDVNENAVALTFDDGYKNFNAVVKPILEEYGFQGTCFVIGKHLSSDNQNMLKTEDIQNDDIVEYYSHSYNLHRKAPGFDRKIIQDLSLNDITEDFACNPMDSTYFAFPYGRSIKDIEPILKDNQVKLAFGYNQLRHMTRDDNPYLLPRYMIVDIMPDWYFRFITQ